MGRCGHRGPHQGRLCPHGGDRAIGGQIHRGGLGVGVRSRMFDRQLAAPQQQHLSPSQVVVESPPRWIGEPCGPQPEGTNQYRGTPCYPAQQGAATQPHQVGHPQGSPYFAHPFSQERRPITGHPIIQRDHLQPQPRLGPAFARSGQLMKMGSQ